MFVHTGKNHTRRRIIPATAASACKILRCAQDDTEYHLFFLCIGHCIHPHRMIEWLIILPEEIPDGYQRAARTDQ
jgi:hypothetical protein